MAHNWYAQKVDDLFGAFKTSPIGLDESEVSRRTETYGKNILQTTKPVTLWSIFIEQFKSPFIYALLAASAIVFFLGETLDGSIIIGIVLINAAIGTFQEGKARNTLAALQNIIKSSATVIRGGDPVVVSDEDLVPGDIILLKDGDIVSADARLFEANDLKVNESSLTGESNAVEKNTSLIDKEDVQTGDQLNMVFRGTYIVSGLGRAIIVQTGKSTAIGGIAQKLDQLNSEVPLKENIRRLAKILMIIVGFFSALIFIVGIMNGNNVIDMFITVVALVVSVIPESLPVVVTLVLATGVWRMSKRNALVKKLQAVEALGQARVIALDKTGTITKNQMVVEKLFFDEKYFEVTGDGYKPKGDVFLDGKKIIPSENDGLKFIGKVSAFTSGAYIAYSEKDKEWQRTMGDPTEAAIVTFAQKIGLPKSDLEKMYPKTMEIPFNYTSKFHTTVNKVEGKNFISTVGSPEVLLDNSTTIWRDGKVQTIRPDDKKKIKLAIDKLSTEGYRIIGLAMATKFSKKLEKHQLPELTFLGLVAIADAIRPDVNQAVDAARDAGMRVVMITGDYAATAKTIALKVGIFREGDRVLSGEEITKIEDIELDKIISEVTVFARVSPEHKLRIIESFQRRGEIVAMTGDGINDALSLTAADLGVAMGKIGTEVAREAADIVLLDDNFDNIRAAVEEGRAIYQTIRKSVLYLLSSNMGELLVITVAVILGWPLPLLAKQIIWLNMVTDTFLVAALSFEPKDPNILKDEFKKPSRYLVDRDMGLRIFLIGVAMTVSSLFMFSIYSDPSDMTKAWTITLTVLTVTQWYNVWNVRSEKKSIFSENPFNNMWLFGGTILAILLHLFAIYAPFMQKILHTTGLSLKEWGIILLISLSVVVVEEIRKFVYRRIERVKDFK